MKRGVASFDGGIRGNPKGPSACAVVLKIDGEIPQQQTRFLGSGSTSTNNTAEVQGMIMALRLAAEAGVTHLTLRSDSKLIVEQALGNWRIKDENLRRLHDSARDLALKYFEEVRINHIPREQNMEADALCTAVLDKITGRFRLTRAKKVALR